MVMIMASTLVCSLITEVGDPEGITKRESNSLRMVVKFSSWVIVGIVTTNSVAAFFKPCYLGTGCIRRCLDERRQDRLSS